jgi:sugar O-acyltransferase (sialic acid O-acetyltransferase NeuD family)
LEAKEKGYRFVTYISPRATYYKTPVGENCFILENNVIQPFVTIGNDVTLWSGNHIGHHSVIKDHCFISSHVVISGSCCIEENCFLGVNCTLRDNIKIGKLSVIGSGAIVMKDCEERSLVQPAQSKHNIVVRDLI